MPTPTTPSLPGHAPRPAAARAWPRGELYFRVA
ncbi:DUF3574 domain-containing protein, partial [Xanthomonas euvesicatoria]